MEYVYALSVIAAICGLAVLCGKCIAYGAYDDDNPRVD